MNPSGGIGFPTLEDDGGAFRSDPFIALGSTGKCQNLCQNGLAAFLKNSRNSFGAALFSSAESQWSFFLAYEHVRSCSALMAFPFKPGGLPGQIKVGMWGGRQWGIPSVVGGCSTTCSPARPIFGEQLDFGCGLGHRPLGPSWTLTIQFQPGACRRPRRARAGIWTLRGRAARLHTSLEGDEKMFEHKN